MYRPYFRAHSSHAQPFVTLTTVPPTPFVEICTRLTHATTCPPCSQIHLVVVGIAFYFLKLSDATGTDDATTSIEFASSATARAEVGGGAATETAFGVSVAALVGLECG